MDDENDVASQQAKIQERLAADAFRYSPEMEAAIARLEKNPDDARMSGSMRLSTAFYLESKNAARRLGRDVTGGQ